MFASEASVEYLQSQIDNHQRHVDDLRSALLNTLGVIREQNKEIMNCIEIIAMLERQVSGLQDLLRVPDDLRELP